MKGDREAAGLEPVPDAGCRLGAEGQGLDRRPGDVVNAPAGHDRVVKHDGGCHEAHEGAHPGEFLAGDSCQGPDDAHTTGAPESVLRDDQRHAPDEQKHHPRDQKCAGTVDAGVLGGNPRKPPDIARADRDTKHAQ